VKSFTSRGVLWRIPECFQGHTHFIDGVAVLDAIADLAFEPIVLTTTYLLIITHHKPLAYLSLPTCPEYLSSSPLACPKPFTYQARPNPNLKVIP
jgi:hypothetical protein